MNVFSKAKAAVSTMTTAKLRAEADRAQEVKAEIDRREEEEAHADELAEAEARAKKNAVKITEFSALAASTLLEAETAQAALDAAVVALGNFTKRDTALVQLRGLDAELNRLGVKTPTRALPPFSVEAIETAQINLAAIGNELGIETAIFRPLLSYR